MSPTELNEYDALIVLAVLTEGLEKLLDAHEDTPLDLDAQGGAMLLADLIATRVWPLVDLERMPGFLKDWRKTLAQTAARARAHYGIPETH